MAENGRTRADAEPSARLAGYRAASALAAPNLPNNFPKNGRSTTSEIVAIMRAKSTSLLVAANESSHFI